tara:strand:- start:542 stop:928 length:387 start_codon:yes stop_codon:yes gene_type:complete
MSKELPAHEQKLKDLGLPTLAETREYRETVGWVPYEEYMEEIYHHCAGREFDQFNMRQDYFDKQIEPNKLLREAAYLLGLKHCDTEEHTEEEQKELEEELYNKFMLSMFTVLNPPGKSGVPWPMDEDV